MRFRVLLPVLLISACAIDDADVGSLDEAAHTGIPHLRVLSTDPAVRSRTAGPLTTVTINFSHAVDMSTVDDSTVWLTHRESRVRVPLTIAPGATAKQIVLTPDLPLADSSRYVVEVHGVLAQIVAEPAEYSGRFYTRFHRPTYSERFTEAGMSQFFHASYDPVARIRQVNRTRTGPDRLPNTPDDIVSFQSEYRYDAQGDNRRLLVREAPGTDGTFGTADDVMQYERFATYDGRGLLRGFTHHAADDGLLATADDYESAVFRRTYDADTDELLLDCDYDAGADLNAFTADDTITKCVRTIDQPGDQRWTLTSIGAGGNGIWGDDDDVLGSPYRVAYLDASGRVTRSESHALAGGAATPSEATLLQVIARSYDANHLLTRTLEWVGPGVDLDWDTPDDVAADRVEYTYDADGFVVLELNFRAGDDALHETGDDWLFEMFDY